MGTRRSALAVLLVAIVLLSACTVAGSSAEDDVPPTGPAPTDSAPTATAPTCPEQVAGGDASTGGFGTVDSAEAAPELGSYEPAWACDYAAVERPDEATSADGPTIMDWELVRGPVRVPAREARELVALISRLRPAPATRACTMELGSRHVLVMVDGDRSVGVVIDGFGCRDVRLTDDLAHTPPGDGGDGEVVAGVLSGPSGLGQLVARIVDGAGGTPGR